MTAENIKRDKSYILKHLFTQTYKEIYRQANDNNNNNIFIVFFLKIINEDELSSIYSLEINDKNAFFKSLITESRVP